MSDDVFFEKNVVANDTKSATTWQREKDSNPHIRSQSPLCYHYTIPLYGLPAPIGEQALLY